MIDYKQFIIPGPGVSDLMPLFANKTAFLSAVKELAQPFRRAKVDKVAGLEARGFILAGAVAFQLKAGFIAIRKKGYLKGKTIGQKVVDYSGKAKVLETQANTVKKGERILIVDDFLETGQQARAAVNLIKKLGGQIVGLSVLADDSNEKAQKFLRRYRYHFLVSYHEAQTKISGKTNLLG